MITETVPERLLDSGRGLWFAAAAATDETARFRRPGFNEDRFSGAGDDPAFEGNGFGFTFTLRRNIYSEQLLPARHLKPSTTGVGRRRPPREVKAKSRRGNIRFLPAFCPLGPLQRRRAVLFALLSKHR